MILTPGGLLFSNASSKTFGERTTAEGILELSVSDRVFMCCHIARILEFIAVVSFHGTERPRDSVRFIGDSFS